MGDLVMHALGQIDGLSFVKIDVGNRHGLVTMAVSGPDGTAHATLTAEAVDTLMTMLKENKLEIEAE
jgi:hypothetical protein